MPEKPINDFDLQLRSMLADTEVKPSRRVWKGISAHLDAAQAAQAASWSWMKWAGMSLAAAAIAAAVLIPGTRKDPIPTNLYNNQEQATLAQAGDPAGAEAVKADTPAAGLVLTEDSPVRTVRRAPVTPEAAPASEITPEAGIAPEPVAEAEAATRDAGTKSVQESGAPERRRRESVAPEAFADSFAEPARTDKRKARRPAPALYAQGTLSSNDASPRQLANFGVRMAPGAPSGFTESSASSFGIPFTVGLGVRFYLTPRLSVDTGLDYSLLTRSFAGSYEGTPGTVTHSLHYLGIPVNFAFDIATTDRIKFYAFGGGEAEYALANRYRLLASPADIVRNYPVKGLQFSAGAGLGVEFRIAGPVGIYFDPGVRYYFPGNQPRNIRTEKPLLINFDAGLRFQLGR